MPNIIITQYCVRSCPYCFASKYMKDDGAFMSWDDFMYCIDFSKASGVNTISILGGEPSLHPQFLEFFAYAQKRMNHVSVFTSGILPDGMASEWKSLIESGGYRERTTIVCNVNEPNITPPAEREKVVDFMEKLGRNVVQGFNIYRPDFDLGFLLQNVPLYGLRRRIRLSMAHPIYGKGNRHLTPDQFQGIIGRLASFLPMFEAVKTLPALDCGFPLCAFSDELAGRFLKAGSTFHWTCAPVVDIGPDLSVWPCFPLFPYNRQSLYDFNSLAELVDYFVKLIGRERRGNSGIYEECDSCEYVRKELCSGGCVANFLPQDNLSRLSQA